MTTYFRTKDGIIGYHDDCDLHPAGITVGALISLDRPHNTNSVKNLTLFKVKCITDDKDSRYVDIESVGNTICLTCKTY